MTDFDRLSWQQKCLTFYEAISVYSSEGCGHGPLAFKLEDTFSHEIIAFLLSMYHVHVLTFDIHIHRFNNSSTLIHVML